MIFKILPGYHAWHDADDDKVYGAQIDGIEWMQVRSSDTYLGCWAERPNTEELEAARKIVMEGADLTC